MRRSRNKAAVALARKLAVAASHVLMGAILSVPIDSEERLHGKVFKLATELGISTIRCLGFDSKDDFIQKKLYVLKSYPKESPRWGTTVPKLLLLTGTIISLFSLTNHMSGSVRICDKVARGAKHRVDDSSGRIAAYRPTTGSKPISLRHPVAFE